jgi:DNA-binding Lrp family transcriptional regulator
MFDRYTPLAFAGSTFEPEHDEVRLTSQLQRVRALMLDGKWRTLREIAAEVQGSEAGVSARIRDLRKPGNGGFVIERKRVGDLKAGLHAYRMAPAENER